MKKLILLPISIILIVITFASFSTQRLYKPYKSYPLDYAKLDSLQNLKGKMDSFLIKPFSLYRFHKKQSGNSSGESKKKNLFKPLGKGMYYNFYYPGLNYYTITSKKSKMYLYGGWQCCISAFHPNDEFMHNQQNPNATLVSYKASLNVPDIPQLAFIGQPIDSVVNKLGEPQKNLDSVIVYHHKNNALFLKQKNKKVTEVKYSKYNFSLDTIKQIPNELLKSIGCWGG